MEVDEKDLYTLLRYSFSEFVVNVYSEAAIVLYTWDISGRKTFSYSRSLLSSIKETMKNKHNK